LAILPRHIALIRQPEVNPALDFLSIDSKGMCPRDQMLVGFLNIAYLIERK
jgi:hypothetical protein